ncbi:hypothetical protein LshimejAT787_1502100 [Lyophyllum shimeji]|uniref:Uncharacterized protein n=1 Tax=Lyophyllum shimeji TaxID=47721 RepID=A0A9P3PZM2_LYOSH|nr:hypothetical protein LshimejAT787_1502100 [Lyophyllum shimeji]
MLPDQRPSSRSPGCAHYKTRAASTPADARSPGRDQKRCEGAGADPAPVRDGVDADGGESGSAQEMAVEYARVREEREWAGEEARRMGSELERGRMERMNGEIMEMRAALERARQVHGGQRKREGEAEREREMSVRAELEMVKAQLETRTKELELEKVLRYNAEKKLRDLQMCLGRAQDASGHRHAGREHSHQAGQRVRVRMHSRWHPRLGPQSLTQTQTLSTSVGAVQA